MANEIYLEHMDASELEFLAKEARKQKRVYDRILIILLSGSVLMSFLGGWHYVKIIDATVFSWSYYAFMLSVLSLLSFGGVWSSKRWHLHKLIKDLRQQTKTIEKVLITKKTFLPHNNTYHLYIDSVYRLSIQVEWWFFELRNEGDEINIEYSTNAKIYFGYF